MLLGQDLGLLSLETPMLGKRKRTGHVLDQRGTAGAEGHDGIEGVAEAA